MVSYVHQYSHEDIKQIYSQRIKTKKTDSSSLLAILANFKKLQSKII